MSTLQLVLNYYYCRICMKLHLKICNTKTHPRITSTTTSTCVAKYTPLVVVQYWTSLSPLPAHSPILIPPLYIYVPFNVPSRIPAPDLPRTNQLSVIWLNNDDDDDAYLPTFASNEYKIVFWQQRMHRNQSNAQTLTVQNWNHPTS